MMDRRRAGALVLGTALAPLGAKTAARKPPPPDPALWDPQIGPMVEGRAAGPNGPVYYRTYGAPGRTPVVALHGGPAAGHRYMRPYAALAEGRQVALYDQSGCGSSARPADLTRYTVERYVAELEALRAHLGYGRMILVGHSWGGFLAPAYAAAHPERVEAMVLAGAAPRWRDYQTAARRWLAELGPAALATVRRAERSGKTDDPAYSALLQTYYARHLCRLDPWPAWFQAEGEALGANPVYAYLNGPSEFDFTGTLKDLDLSATLRRLPMPALVTCGAFDEAPPWVGRRLAALLPRARFVGFEGLSHMSHIEDPQRVIAATGAFLAQLP